MKRLQLSPHVLERRMEKKETDFWSCNLYFFSQSEMRSLSANQFRAYWFAGFVFVVAGFGKGGCLKNE